MFIEDGYVSCRNPNCTVTFRDDSHKIFCCRSCASKLNSKGKRRPLSEETKQKIRAKAIERCSPHEERECHNKGKISDEQLLNAIGSTRSLCQALTSLGMAAKGGNYKRAKRLKTLVDSVGVAPTVFVS
jgi:hypothetical protein